ncbi:hypothetical protein ABK040_005454 [Willaertia magna]
MQKVVALTLLLIVATISLVSTQPSPISVIQTARNTGDRLTPLNTRIQWQNNTNPTNNIVYLNPKVKFQKILGFGCALTEAAGYTFSTMNEANKQKILDAFWTPKGLNYTMGRIHMNSCDFSLGSYSCDDVAGDFDLKYFNINRDRQYILPLIKRVFKTQELNYKSRNFFNIFLSPWSPPAWMKAPNNGVQQMDGSARPFGLLNFTRVLDSWALHYSKFVDAYKQEGIDRIWGLTVQNEPEFAAPWEACCYTPEAQRDFIKNHLGPRMKSDHPDLKLMIFDHNRDHVDVWAKTIYSDPVAAKYVDGTAFHWYSDEGYENLSKAYSVNPNKFLLATEACWDNGVKLGDWSRGEKYGYDIINDLNNYASGWMDWNCILDWKGGPNHLSNWCDAPIIADNRTQEIHYQLTYYYFGHFTKYLQPGTVRIQLYKDAIPDVYTTSFLTLDNNIVTICQNQGDSERTIYLKDTSFPTYYAEVTLPAHSIRTLIYSANQ